MEARVRRANGRRNGEAGAGPAKR